MTEAEPAHLRFEGDALVVVAGRGGSPALMAGTSPPLKGGPPGSMEGYRWEPGNLAGTKSAEAIDESS